MYFGRGNDRGSVLDAVRWEPNLILCWNCVAGVLCAASEAAEPTAGFGSENTVMCQQCRGSYLRLHRMLLDKGDHREPALDLTPTRSFDFLAISIHTCHLPHLLPLHRRVESLLILLQDPLAFVPELTASTLPCFLQSHSICIPLTTPPGKCFGEVCVEKLPIELKRFVAE